jgi:hypothetical protein
MRLGRVVIHGYTVDLDNEEMVEHAKTALYEDIMNAVKFNEVGNYIYIEKERPVLKAEDIPEFLKDEEEENGY